MRAIGIAQWAGTPQASRKPWNGLCGHAVRLNGIVRASEHAGILAPFAPPTASGRAKAWASRMPPGTWTPAWFSGEANLPEAEHIRVAEPIVIDILVAASRRRRMTGKRARWTRPCRGD